MWDSPRPENWSVEDCPQINPPWVRVKVWVGVGGYHPRGNLPGSNFAFTETVTEHNQNEELVKEFNNCDIKQPYF